MAGKAQRRKDGDMTTDADAAEDIAMMLLLLKALAQRVAEETETLKDELAQLIRPGTLLRPELDGQPAGSVTMTTGRGRAEVYDDAAFLAWTRKHYPEYVSLQPVIDGDFRAKCLVVSAQAGVPVSPYGDLDVGGIRASKGEPVLSVRPDKKRTAQLWAAIRADPPLDELEGTT